VRRLAFFAGKGGVGKTTLSASAALQLARSAPQRRYAVISVDPAHSLADVFAREAPPPNLSVETIDTRARWAALRDTLGTEVRRAVDALTPGGLSVAYDAEAIEKLIEIAPPGADELFAINRLAELIADDSLAAIVVDTAPTGHFLRLVDLPATAGEWVREFMRILLRYREVLPAASLGEELVRASRALTALEQSLRSDQTEVVVVTRPERIVVAETRRLLDAIETRGMHASRVVANYVTPENDCRCDRSMRRHETDALRTLGDVTTIERRGSPPVTLDDIATLFPLH
jgi:arsenite-transporting ATPase